MVSQAIAFSFPIKPNFSTVLPFKFIWFSLRPVNFEIDLIILLLYFETLEFQSIEAK